MLISGSDKKKVITVVTPCYNEEANVRPLHEKIKEIFGKQLPGYELEHLFIDNCSQDGTVAVIEDMAASDKTVKAIVNSRNFGHIRSPYYAFLQASGDAVMMISADFQDPPDLIPQFVKKWEEGYKQVLGVKTRSRENPIMFAVRKFYYKLIKSISDVEMVENYMGFGLYDKRVVQILRGIKDPYPYMRGLICEIGFKKAFVEYVQPERAAGRSHNNFASLYDMAILAITSYSKVPLRIATFIGLSCACLSFLVALFYFGYKLLFWDRFSVGIAPLVIGGFFFSSVQLFFIGIIGEYICNIYTKVQNYPLVIEERRINFDR